MSQDGDGELVAFQRDTWHVARKAHKCRACHEPIGAGYRYHLTFYVWEKEPYTIKRCERCQLIFTHLASRIADESDEEYCDESLACGHEYEERWGEKPPEWLAALAFWRPGDPLPEMPATVSR